MLLDWLIRKKVTAFEQELLQKYYAEVESMYTKMRGWRHDYRHHIQTLKVHASKGEMNEVQKYLDMLDDDLTNVEAVVRTGNRITDAILNSKLSLAREKQITVKAETNIPVPSISLLAKSSKICYNKWGFLLYTKAEVNYDTDMPER